MCDESGLCDYSHNYGTLLALLQGWRAGGKRGGGEIGSSAVALLENISPLAPSPSVSDSFERLVWQAVS